MTRASRIHYGSGRGAHCGASNNRKIGHRTAATTDRARVTCRKCRQYIDSGQLDAFLAYLAELEAADMEPRPDGY